MHDFEDSSQWLFDHEGLRRLAEAEARGYARGKAEGVIPAETQERGDAEIFARGYARGVEDAARTLDDAGYIAGAYCNLVRALLKPKGEAK